MNAVFECRPSSNAYGWQWTLKVGNGHSVMSAGVSRSDCLHSATDYARREGWTLVVAPASTRIQGDQHGR